MGQFSQSVFTAALTLIGGTVLYLLTQIAGRLWIEPMQRIRETLGEIAYALHYYGWAYVTRPEEHTKQTHEKASELMRELSSKLRSQAAVLLNYQVFATLGVVPPLPDLDEAAGRMIRISNRSSLTGDRYWDVMYEDTQAVERLLRLVIRQPKDARNQPKT